MFVNFLIKKLSNKSVIFLANPGIKYVSMYSFEGLSPIIGKIGFNAANLSHWKSSVIAVLSIREPQQ